MHREDKRTAAWVGLIVGGVIASVMLTILLGQLIGWWSVCVVYGPVALAALIFGARYLWQDGI